jgi:tetratricopeptide (TPR) repeat protein
MRLLRGAIESLECSAVRITGALALVAWLLLMSVPCAIASPGEDFNRGMRLLLSGNYEQAAALFEKVVAAEPDNADAWVHLGIARKEQKRFGAAAKALEQATRLRPDDADAYFYLGDAYSGAKKDEEAVKAYRASLKLGPEREYVEGPLKTSLKRLGREGEALQPDEDSAQPVRSDSVRDPGEANQNAPSSKPAAPTTSDKPWWSKGIRGTPMPPTVDKGRNADESNSAKTAEPSLEPDSGAENSRATRTPATTSQPKPGTAADAVPSGNTPEDVVHRALMGQVRGDAEAMMAEAALDLFDDNAREISRKTLGTVCAKLALSEFKFEPVATGYSTDGTMALTRFRYSVTAKVGGGNFPQAGGSMALLVKRGGGWKIHTIAADELLTLQVLEETGGLNAPSSDAQSSLLQMPGPVWPGHASMPQTGSPLQPPRQILYAVYTGAAPPVVLAQSPPRAASRERLVDIKRVNDAINKSMLKWHVDEGKIARDEFYSAWGHVPIIGDVLSSGYTVTERINTVMNELPQDIKDGNVTAALTDIGITAWGVVQVAAEPFPGLDSLTDQVEVVIDQYRYHHVQRHNYYKVYRKVMNSNFRDDPKYLFLRYTSKYMPVEGEARDVKQERYPEWTGRWPALKRLTILTDRWMRAKSPIVFDIALDMTVKRSESEDIYEAMKSLGAMTKRSGSFDDQVARLEVRMTSLAARDVSSGAPIMTNFRLAGKPYAAYDLACNRGLQKLVVEMKDGSRTQPVDVDNLVLNAIAGFQLQLPDGRKVESHKLNQDDRVSKAKLVPVMAKQDKYRVEPPELTGLECLKAQVVGTDLMTVTNRGRWPQALLDIEARQGGIAVYEVGFAGAEGASELKGGITFEIAGEAKKPGFEYVMTKIQRQGLGGKVEPSAEGGVVSLSGNDTQYSRTWTVEAAKSDGSGKLVRYTYQVTVSASVGVPTVMRARQSLTIPVSVSISTGGGPPLSAVLNVTAPNWQKEQPKASAQSASPFGFDPFTMYPYHITKTAESGGGPVEETMELVVPEILSEGGSVSVGFELHVRGKTDGMMTDAANMELRRGFCYTSQRTK